MRKVKNNAGFVPLSVNSAKATRLFSVIVDASGLGKSLCS